MLNEKLEDESGEEHTEDEINEMFETCLDEIQGDSRSFIESIYDQWEKKSSLSPKQISGLKRFYENIA